MDTIKMNIEFEVDKIEIDLKNGVLTAKTATSLKNRHEHCFSMPLSAKLHMYIKDELDSCVLNKIEKYNPRGEKGDHLLEKVKHGEAINPDDITIQHAEYLLKRKR